MRINKKERVTFLLFGIIALLGIGYAYLSTNLSIDGISNITRANWNVHFENVQVTQGSVTTVTQAPTINSDLISINYAITLNEPGDFYEFTVDVKNSGTIDAMIETVTSTINGVSPSELPNYLKYSATYSDGIEIANNHLLEANTKETYKIRIEYNQDIDPEDLPQTDQTYNIVFAPSFIQKTSAAKPVLRPGDFSTDSWETIQAVAQTGNACDYYNLGDTKEVDMGSFGTHVVRIVNCSTPPQCNDSSFSQSACGLVLEFADGVVQKYMNSDYSGNTIGTGNNGGWPASEAYQFMQTELLNSMPNDLKNAIIDTRVITGHGSANSTNYVSNDKLYLITFKELIDYEFQDTAVNTTRQLDYYRNLGCNSTNMELTKKYTTNNNNIGWWLRTSSSSSQYNFQYSSGYVSSYLSNSNFWICPTFRIG